MLKIRNGKATIISILRKLQFFIFTSKFLSLMWIRLSDELN